MLDIGAGTGYLLVVCRHMGDDVMALDLANEPLYNECIEFFGLPRVVHRVEPGAPLPTFAEPLDVITAFMATFDLLPGGEPWRSSDWDYFLNDVRQRLRPGGKLVIGLNTHHGNRFLSESYQRRTGPGTPEPGSATKWFSPLAERAGGAPRPSLVRSEGGRALPAVGLSSICGFPQ